MWRRGVVKEIWELSRLIWSTRQNNWRLPSLSPLSWTNQYPMFPLVKYKAHSLLGHPEHPSYYPTSSVSCAFLICILHLANPNSLFLHLLYISRISAPITICHIFSVSLISIQLFQSICFYFQNMTPYLKAHPNRVLTNDTTYGYNLFIFRARVAACYWVVVASNYGWCNNYIRLLPTRACDVV